MQWLLEAGFWDQRQEDRAAMRLAQPVVASGGRDLSLQMLSRAGATLLGHVASIDGSIATFDDSTAANVTFADGFAQRTSTLIYDFIWLSRRNSGILHGFPIDAHRIAAAISARVSDRKSA